MIILRIPHIIFRMISNINVIVPKQLSNDKPHLHIRQTAVWSAHISINAIFENLLSAYASSRTKRESIRSMKFICCVLFVEPALWSEYIWIAEISFTVCGSPHTYRHRSLLWNISVNHQPKKNSNKRISLTPSGMNSPLTVSPPCGTVLTKPIGALGKMRRPSSITAVRYGSLTKFSNVKSASDLKLERISAVSRSKMCLWLGRMIWLNRPVKKPAVVSVPAIMNNAPFTITSSRFSWSLSCCLIK